LNLNTTGYFFGQCSELCGTNHAFMPINIISTDYEDFFEISLLEMKSYKTK
jgi:cytochrome c oxidase subunit 2